MKIAYMIRSTHTNGGMDRILSKKTSYLVNHNYDVTIITTDQKGRRCFFDYSDKIKRIDLDVNYLHASGKPLLVKLLALPFRAICHWFRLNKVLKRERFDIVISMFDGEVRFFNKINDGSKKIAEIHLAKSFRSYKNQSSIVSRTLTRFAERIDESVVSKLDKFVVLTDEDKFDWLNKHNTTRIYNFVDVPNSISSVKNKTAIAIGRLDYQKGFDTLVEIWAIVNKRYPDWRLDIYGSGQDKERLQAQIDRLRLNEVIKINTPTTDIYSKILDSSIYLLTSRYEGFGLVLAEAMACGVPPVSFACKCGPRDIITDGENGFLVEQDDVDTFAERVCQLIENEPLRKEMGKNARRNIEERFSEEVIMKQWEKLFAELVDKK